MKLLGCASADWLHILLFSNGPVKVGCHSLYAFAGVLFSALVWEFKININFLDINN